VVLLTGQYLALTGRATTAADRDAQLARWYESEPRLTAAELVAPGRIRVVVFSDYLCPACSLQIPGIERTVNRYHIGGDENVELVLRDFPLNADCNPSVMTRTHPLACRAAVAARVADRVLDPAKSQAFRDRLYARHGRLAEADLVRDLEAVHLLEEFNETYDKELNAVRDDARLGGALGIASTPTVFVDGRLLRDTQPRVLSAILSHLGRNAGAGTVERRK
jgi:protein-disulfide isomerase